MTVLQYSAGAAHRNTGRWRGAAALCVFAACLWALVAAAEARQPATGNTLSAPADAFPSFVALRLNDQSVSESTLVLRMGPGGARLALSANDATALRFDLRTRSRPVTHDGETYYPLDGVAGLAYAFDEVTQTLSLTAAADIFSAAQITVPPPSLVNATRPALGAFLSYDLLSQHSSAASDAVSGSGQAELGVFTPYGVFTQSAFATLQGDSRRGIRLDSTFTIDRPDQLASWRIGDAITRSAGWSSAARFGGIQFATNFSTQPTLITYPLNTASGQTTLPSLVDVYVNNVLTGTQRVPAGPFTLNELPAVNGQGEIRLVVRDLLGREQAFVQSLYGSTTLLREGLDDFAFQAGTLRENYGTDSAEYGRGFAAGLWRRGVARNLTLEGSAELAREHGAAGIGGSWLLGGLGQVSAAAAWSRKRFPELPPVPPESPPAPPPMEDVPTGMQGGRSLALAWERRSTTISLGAQARLNSPQFRSVTQGSTPPSRREVTAFASYGAGSGSASIGYASISRQGEPRTEFVQLTLSRGLKEWGFISLSAATALRGDRNDSITLSYALPLDFMTTAGVNTSSTETPLGRRQENRITLQRSLPTTDGYGYRLDISDQQRAFFDVRTQQRTGLYSLELARLSGNNAVRVGASGSLVLIGGELSAARRVEEAFGLVQVPGFANVRVYLDNQELGRTNATGNFFVSRLRPYQVNQLSIEQSDLPMSAEVMSLKLDATPFLKSGVVVRFAVKESQGGLARFVDTNGTELPPGSVVTHLDSGEQYPIADGGLAFLTGLAPSNRLRVSWQGKSCTITVKYQPGDDPQPMLGTFSCRLS